MCKNGCSQLRVAAAQLGVIPPHFFGLVSAGEAFKCHADIGYERYLKTIDVVGIKEYNISKMVSLLLKASRKKVNLVVFPELSLTGFFPYLFIKNTSILNSFFETSQSLKLVEDFFIDICLRERMSVCFGFAEFDEKTKQRYNTSVYLSEVGTRHYYRKTHIPGFKKPDCTKQLFQFELGIFSSSNEGYPVYKAICNNQEVNVGMLICHDRRYGAPFLSMGLKNVNIIFNGYNTPFDLSFAKELNNYVYKFHYLPLQSQAVSEGTFIISAARAGDSYGVQQIAGSCIVSPYGKILVKTEKLREELIIADIDLNDCQQVKAQKYWGSRSRPEVLVMDIMANCEGVEEKIIKLRKKIKSRDAIFDFE